MTLTLDSGRRTLSDGTRTLRLRPAWVTVIQAMAYGRCSYSQLIVARWAGRETEDPMNALKVEISVLRAALRQAGFSPLVITVWGVGFRLAEAVTVVNDISAGVTIPAELVPLLRAILYSTKSSASDRLLAVVGA